MMLCKNFFRFAFCILLGGAVAQGSPFGSWSASGVVVNKTFRSTPLTDSLGVDGIYKLELRDRDNKVRRQMVTRAVFLVYEIGDEFNELAWRHKTPKARITSQHAVAAEADNSSPVTKVAIKDRLANPHFTQDMLPENEGF
ncbi:MAG TPA: hypothetical protein VNW28_02580 [Chthoniobacterales bacterium]|nr:hypothetical protein [Chthoniobacterales bacterium]